MSIIQPKQEISFEKIRLKISSELLMEVKAYGDKFGLKNLDDFFNQAAQHILKIDKEWIKVKDQNLNRK